MQLLLNGVLVGSNSSTVCLHFEEECVSGTQIKKEVEARFGVPLHEQRLVLSAREIGDGVIITKEEALALPPIRLLLRLVGGKGGFGALLRGGPSGFRKKAESNDDCRDLGGRRLRHVNNEKKLAEWYAEQKERDLEKLAAEFVKKKEYEDKTHFDAEKYFEQLQKISSTVSSSIEHGLSKHLLSEVKQLDGALPSNEKRKEEAEEDENEEEGLETEDGEFDPEAFERILKKRQKRDYVKMSGSVHPSSSVATTSASATPEVTSPRATSVASEAENNVSRSSSELSYSESPPTSSSSYSSSSSSSSSPNAAPSPPILDVEAIESLDELLKHSSLETLKLELQRRGMLCGGTLDQRATRLWSVRGVPLDQIDESVKPGHRNPRNNKKRKR